ncbi:MAG: hypothetical protein ACM3JB_17285 [Acidobacteriaceae bacterium]
MLRLRPIFFLLLAVAIPAAATPKRPDLKKLLAQPQTKPGPYIPARAGWDGPEQNPRSIAYLQQLSAVNSPQGNRATLLNILIPDWRFIIALLATIFVLRYLRGTTWKAPRASHQQPRGDIPHAA